MPRLSMALCPACEQPNADEAQVCGACGTPLVMRCPACDTINVRTRSVCHRCRAPLRSTAEPTATDASAAADASAGPDTEPAVVLTLRSDALEGRGPAYWRDPSPATVASAAPPQWVAGADPSAIDWPTLDAEPSVGPAQGAPPGPTLPTQHQRAKAERRAKVRQRQLRTQRDKAATAAAPPTDMLLLEPDAESRAVICSVLEAFGFRTHVIVDAAEAAPMSQRRRYAAVLLGNGGPDQDIASLCHRLRRQPTFGATPVFAIGDPDHHAERVRMQLAGAQDTLLRPVTRGALAQMLNRHGVVLPRDPRVGGPPSS